MSLVVVKVKDSTAAKQRAMAVAKAMRHVAAANRDSVDSNALRMTRGRRR